MTNLKFNKRDQAYYNSSKSLKVDVDGSFSTSYSHYFIHRTFKTKKGENLVVFNNYSYSNSTCKHINQVLKHLGYNFYDLQVQDFHGLNNLPKLLDTLQNKIGDTLADIKRRTGKASINRNIERAREIKSLYNQIQVISTIQGV